MIDYNDFEKWINNNELLYKNFCLIKTILMKYIEEEVKDDNQLCTDIYLNFNTVILKCDEITYDENGVPLAYVLLHFLDRYHRFQLIFMEMLKKGYFYIGEDISLMDIGTGPGPSMYAFSDMIELINKYAKEKSGKPIIKNVKIDYVEQSNGFRYFLHKFTECLYMNKVNCYVPFHFGTYYNAEEMEFSGYREITSIIKGFIAQKKVVRAKKSFNIIIYSNFLTNESIVKRLKRQLYNAAFYLKNKGCLLIVGANPHDKKYVPVYKLLDSIVLEQEYNTCMYRGSCKKVINASKMEYAENDKIIPEIKSFYKDVINMITKNDWDKLEDDFREKMCLYLNNNKREKWYITLYKRYSIANNVKNYFWEDKKYK